MKLLNSFCFLASVLLLLSCASPQMRRWEGRSLTLCCATHACSAEKWAEKLKAHCPKGGKLVGEETNEKVSGFKTSPDANKTGQTTKVETHHETCRKYECSGDIVP